MGMNYHNANHLLQILEENNFEVLNVSQKHIMKNQITNLIFIWLPILLKDRLETKQKIF